METETTTKGNGAPAPAVREAAYLDRCRTLTGLPLLEAFHKLDDQLPPGAYKEIKGGRAGAIGLTDIIPGFLPGVLLNLFGPEGLGWGFEVISMETSQSGSAWLVTTRLKVWYGYVIDGDTIRTSVPLEVTGGSDNAEVEWAQKGAITNALGTAWFFLGYQLSVYQGVRSHTNAGVGANRGQGSRPAAGGGDSKPSRQPPAAPAGAPAPKASGSASPSPASDAKPTSTTSPAAAAAPAPEPRGEATSAGGTTRPGNAAAGTTRERIRSATQKEVRDALSALLPKKEGESLEDCAKRRVAWTRWAVARPAGEPAIEGATSLYEDEARLVLKKAMAGEMPS